MQPQHNKLTLVPELPEEILKALTPSKDVAINSAHLCIQWLNELASELPTRYGWRVRTAEAFTAEFHELAAMVKDALPLNRLYWEDALKNCEAYSVMATWPAPGSEDTELGVLMELEVGHGETEVYARVQT